VNARWTNTTQRHRIIDLCRAVYVDSPPWGRDQLASHLKIFPEGQFIAEDVTTGRIVGMAASLIIWWDDYDIHSDWREFTDSGYFTNHDPEHGRTLYGAEVMVHPAMQGHGIGKKLYAARRELVKKIGLLRIRAGARLRGYHKRAEQLAADQYVIKVVNEELCDPTLSFQLRQGFHVMAVVQGYIRHDPESLGWAAVIEWINDEVAKPEDYKHRDPRFARRTAAVEPDLAQATPDLAAAQRAALSRISSSILTPASSRFRTPGPASHPSSHS
jgi:GNAT superfamily N-acetyltransferase